jgi:hypothetical protein
MVKSLVTVAAALSLTASAQQAYQDEDDWSEDVKAYIQSHEEQDAYSETDYQQLGDNPDAYLEFVRGGGRRWTCFARSRGGKVFSGSSTSANQARRIAMNRCISRSNGCSLRSCR